MSWEMIQVICEFRFFNKKLITFKFSQHRLKNLLFEVIVVFCYFFTFRFSHIYIVCRGLIQWKKGFASVSLLPFTKKWGRSSYAVTMTHYDVILVLFLLRFAVVGQFSCSNYEQKRSYKDLFATGKNDPPAGLDGPKTTQA